MIFIKLEGINDKSGIFVNFLTKVIYLEWLQSLQKTKKTAVNKFLISFLKSRQIEYRQWNNFSMI